MSWETRETGPVHVKVRDGILPRRLNDLRLAARPTLSTRTEPSVTIRPLIPSSAQRLSNICAETDDLQLPAAAGTCDKMRQDDELAHRGPRGLVQVSGRVNGGTIDRRPAPLQC